VSPSAVRARFLERLMALHAAYAVLGGATPDGLWLTWAEAQELLAALSSLPAEDAQTEVPHG